MRDEQDNLTALFAEYRGALPDPEPAAGFTPGLWARIEVRRREASRLSLLARRMVAFAGGTSLAMILMVFVPLYRTGSPALTSTYLESLAENHQELVEVDVSAAEAQ